VLSVRTQTREVRAGVASWRWRLSWTILAVCLATTNAAERWKLQYFYDQDRSELELRDLACPTTERCVAVGVINQDGHEKGAAVITSDSGEHWSLVELKERPTCLFFRSDTLGWMATNGGIWRTNESGRTWTKLQKLEGIASLYFLDESHGYAAGSKAAAYETSDGGKTWKQLSAAEQPAPVRERTVYDWISFDGPLHGFILGYSGTPPKSHTPDWVDPERARFHSGDPITEIMLETRDGGKTWKASKQESTGDLARIKIIVSGAALGLVEYPNFSKFPSEVARVDLTNFRKQIVYRQADRLVTDIAPLPGGEVFLAAIDAPGRLKDIPIPGKLKISSSTDLDTWKDMDVDYRAEAQRAIFAGSDRAHLWMATDTGMILKLDDSRR
jgi:photosystem II stability/assembly factor-like uncharacterized protein